MRSAGSRRADGWNPHPGIRTGKAKRHQIGMQLLHGPLPLTRLPGLGLQPARQLISKGVNLALPLRRRKFWLDGVRRQMLGHRIMRHSGQPRDLADRQLLPQMHPSDDVQ